MARILPVLVLVLVLAAPASAAEQQTLTSEQPTASFRGELGAGFTIGGVVDQQLPCSVLDLSCETTLVRLGARGRLDARAVPDMDLPELNEHALALFRSDAAGTRGERVAMSHGAALTHADLPAGFYLLLVKWDEGAGGYEGRLTLTPRRAGKTSTTPG